MSEETPRWWHWLILACLIPIACVLLTVAYSPHPEPPSPTQFVTMHGWSLSDLSEHLQRADLDLRVVRGAGEVSPLWNVYLTSTDATWVDLERLYKGEERIDAWTGTVFVERAAGACCKCRVEDWGDCCLEAGPFIFFGDRALLARIRQALEQQG